MSDTILKVDKLANGYEVSICDPDVLAGNEKPKASWKDPWKEFAFPSTAEVVKFITLHLDTLKPEPDEETQFGKALAERAMQEEE